MRRIFPTIITLLLLWVTVAVGAAAVRSVDIVGPAIADRLTVNTPMEQILVSDAALSPDRGTNWGWVFFTLIVLVGAAVGIMAVARPYLKELRLLLKTWRGGGQKQQSGPTIIPQVPYVSRTPQLTDGEQPWQVENQSPRF